MHKVIENGVEDFLGGQIRRDFQNHLDACADCRRELDEVSRISSLFGSLTDDRAVAPEPGFYYRVSQTIQKRPASPWSIFWFDSAFTRRVAFASLMTLAVAGGLLISNESSVPDSASPESVMAQHDPAVPHDSGSYRDIVLTSLVSYEQ